MQLAQLMRAFVEQQELHGLEGSIATAIPGVRFYRASSSSKRQPLLYQSGLIVMGQGRKVVHLGDHSVSYGPGDYLVLGVPLPLECDAYIENGEPLLGLAIDVAPQLLHQLVSELETGLTAQQRCQPACGLQSVSLPDNMLHACERLMQTLLVPAEASILGADIVKEIIYRTLIGPQGQTLFGLVQFDGHYARVARALGKLHAEYASAITVEQLADDVNMSVSAFHRAFRQVTMESPLQYLKKVRLVKAKELMTLKGRRASEAARLVGYTSPSQFSREFKRQFNQPPSAVSS